MNLLETLSLYEEEIILNESGIRNITSLGKEYKEAEIYFHKDLDGVTSALGMIAYLKKYGIKTTRIHTDHHEGQVGVEKGTSTAFVHEPSNSAFISQRMSPNDLFPPKDLNIISTVDSADFARQGLTPDDIMRAVYKTDPNIDVSKNHRAMGFAVNTLLLAYKNKPDFLTKLVLTSKPSLISMYNIIKKLAKENGYKTPEEVYTGKMDYVAQQKMKNIQGSLSDVTKLKSGQHIMIGSTIVQYGGGGMFKGYDRYTPFKNNPEADFMTIVWPMGLIQLSKNPFKPGANPYHLGDIAQKVLKKFKGELSKKIVSLDTMKYIFERDIDVKDVYTAMGFTFKDLMALFGKKLKGLKGSDKWEGMVQDITNKPYKRMSKKQKDILKKVTITLWDIIQSQSGGHKDITNLSGWNFWGKGFTDYMKKVQMAIAKEMQNKHLKD